MREHELEAPLETDGARDLAVAFAPPAPEQTAADKAMANANNPLANMKAFNIQNYYYSELYGTDADANTAWLRYAQPFGKWLMRASLPLPTSADQPGVDSVSGIGDFHVFFAYLLSDPSSPEQFGIGQPKLQFFAALNMQFLGK